MPIDPTNDTVEVYADAEGLWRWRRVDDGNGRIVSSSSEGYTSEGYAAEAAKAYNAGAKVITLGGPAGSPEIPY